MLVVVYRIVKIQIGKVVGVVVMCCIEIVDNVMEWGQ